MVTVSLTSVNGLNNLVVVCGLSTKIIYSSSRQFIDRGYSYLILFLLANVSANAQKVRIDVNN